MGEQSLPCNSSRCVWSEFGWKQPQWIFSSSLALKATQAMRQFGSDCQLTAWSSVRSGRKTCYWRLTPLCPMDCRAGFVLGLVGFSVCHMSTLSLCIYSLYSSTSCFDGGECDGRICKDCRIVSKQLNSRVILVHLHFNLM